jgi:hypothetical protein
MGVSRLSNPVFNPYEFKTQRKVANFTTSSTPNTYTTLLSVTGKGALFKAMIMGSFNFNRKIKITVDGVVVFWGSGTSPGSTWSSSFGVLQQSDQLTGGNGSATSGMPVVTIGKNLTGMAAGGTFPLSTEQVMQISDCGISAILPMPIEFKTSLLIEVSSANQSDSVYYETLYAI